MLVGELGEGSDGIGAECEAEEREGEGGDWDGVGREGEEREGEGGERKLASGLGAME